MKFQIGRKNGPLHNGSERAKGVRYHAVPAFDDEPLCGRAPARGWSSTAGEEVTCPACLKALAPIHDVVFVPGAPESVSF